MVRRSLVLVTAAALAACGQSEPEPGTARATAQEREALEGVAEMMGSPAAAEPSGQADQGGAPGN